MTNEHSPTRRAILGAAVAIPAVALVAAVPVLATTGGDAELLAAWREYRRARLALNNGDGADDSPETVAYIASLHAMDRVAPPTTIAGVIACLRFALSNQSDPCDGELQEVAIEGTPAATRAVILRKWGELDGDVIHIAGGVIALEAIAAA